MDLAWYYPKMFFPKKVPQKPDTNSSNPQDLGEAVSEISALSPMSRREVLKSGFLGMLSLYLPMGTKEIASSSTYHLSLKSEHFIGSLTKLFQAPGEISSMIKRLIPGDRAGLIDIEHQLHSLKHELLTLYTHKIPLPTKKDAEGMTNITSEEILKTPGLRDLALQRFKQYPKTYCSLEQAVEELRDEIQTLAQFWSDLPEAMQAMVSDLKTIPNVGTRLAHLLSQEIAHPGKIASDLSYRRWLGKYHYSLPGENFSPQLDDEQLSPNRAPPKEIIEGDFPLATVQFGRTLSRVSMLTVYDQTILQLYVDSDGQLLAGRTAFWGEINGDAFNQDELLALQNHLPNVSNRCAGWLEVPLPKTELLTSLDLAQCLFSAR